MGVLASIGEIADWFLRGTRAYALAGILFVFVAITGTFAPEILVVYNLALLAVTLLVIVAGYIAKSRCSVRFPSGSVPTSGV